MKYAKMLALIREAKEAAQSDLTDGLRNQLGDLCMEWLATKVPDVTKLEDIETVAILDAFYDGFIG